MKDKTGNKEPDLVKTIADLQADIDSLDERVERQIVTTARLEREKRRLKAELQQVMEKNCGVFRTEEVLEEGVNAVKAIQEKLTKARISDYSNVFNTARIEALELENLMDVAIATIMSAHMRQESRGAHSRIDFPERDDVNWLRHSLYHKASNSVDYKPVRMKPLTVETFPPKPRTY